ncbi:MAG TPA: thiamine pyrophosphate-dependent enzyme [Terracidiphilus sp.]|nr:thiamine pyrophosphate-dependent enzyme [Terracidiphilus sp.]
MTARTTRKPSTAAPEAAPEKPAFSLIPHDRLLQMYSTMLHCRMLAERVARLASSRRIASPLAAGLGREAVFAGAVCGLLPTDLLSTTDQDALAAFVKGAPIHRILAPLAAKRRKASSAPGKSASPSASPDNVLPPAASLVAQLHLACGVALAHQPMPAGPILVTLCGEGSAPLEAWQQALNFAGSHNLPVLFVCHSEARDEVARLAAEARFGQLADLAHTARVPAIAVDAEDVVAVYRVASESISRARLRRGPTLIECRLQASSGTAAADPIANIELYLRRKNLFDPRSKTRILADFRRTLDAACKALQR